VSYSGQRAGIIPNWPTFISALFPNRSYTIMAKKPGGRADYEARIIYPIPGELPLVMGETFVKVWAKGVLNVSTVEAWYDTGSSSGSPAQLSISTSPGEVDTYVGSMPATTGEFRIIARATFLNPSGPDPQVEDEWGDYNGVGRGKPKTKPQRRKARK